MGEVDISVVVPTYNRSEMLHDAIESLIRQETHQELSFEIVVVDNASTDSTESTVQHFATVSPIPVRYVFEEVPGDAHARNRGVSEAWADWLAFMDDDEVAEQDWLKQLYITAVEKEAAIVGGAVHVDLSGEDKERYGRLCRRALRETQDPKKRGVHLYTRNRLPSTANVLIRRNVFESIGSFATSLVSGCSDSDLVLRARAAGYDLWYTPNAVVHHRVSAHRLTPAYFRWDSKRDGISLAYLDVRHRGWGKTTFLCLARIGQALAVNLPLLVWAYLSGDRPEALGRESLLWRAVGYTREYLFLLAPGIFPQKRFFAPLELRKRAEALPESAQPAN
jgi:GT2 family glycosyltransferase